jgi:hypothetical protein
MVPAMNNPRAVAILAVIAAAALARLLPHPPNVAPIAAMALFAGAHIGSSWGRPWAAFAIPLAAMALSDLVLGPHDTLIYVYAAFALTVLCGRLLAARQAPLAVAGASVGASLLFFAVTNFGVWTAGQLYPLTWDGLIACYVAALPYLRLTMLGDLAYAALLFGGFALAGRYLPELRQAAR